ncbi:hypothetical protein J6590_032501 [Homalodisca vitripennis]|nr:hypothetical protein J6590_032501 [Homalodisca vitripennis]
MKNQILLCKDMCNKYSNDQLLLLFKNLKRHYRLALQVAKIQKNEEIIEHSYNKCKAAWNIINKTAKRSPVNNLGSNIQPDDFNNYFITAVEDISSKVKASPESAMQCLKSVNLVSANSCCVFSPVSSNEVFNIIISLKNSSSRDVAGTKKRVTILETSSAERIEYVNCASRPSLDSLTSANKRVQRFPPCTAKRLQNDETYEDFFNNNIQEYLKNKDNQKGLQESSDSSCSPRVAE